ncbi:rhomboid family intramembrane serine protease [Halovulum sp. GXIMD14793]
MIPAMVTQQGDYQSVLTSMFLHGGFMHLAGNMLFLWIFGDNLEDSFGHIWFLIFYLLSGLGAAAAHIVADPTSTVPTVGASGAIAGVMGGYLLLFPKARVDVLLVLGFFWRLIALPAWVVLGVWFGLQVFSGASQVGVGGGGVAYWAHVGGFVAGVAMVVPYFLRQGGGQFWIRVDGHPPHPPTFEGVSSIPVVRRRR